MDAILRIRQAQHLLADQPALQTALQELAELSAAPATGNPELLEKLRALGYVD